MSGAELAAGGQFAGTLLTALTAGGQIAQGNAAKQQGEYNNRVLRNEALAREREAGFAAARSRAETRRALATQRNVALSQGGTLEGTPKLFLQETAGEGALQQEAILRGGEAAGNRLRSQGAIAKWSGRNARNAAYLAAGATLLNGGSQLAQAPIW